jgi:hypothetical protein
VLALDDTPLGVDTMTVTRMNRNKQLDELDGADFSALVVLARMRDGILKQGERDRVVSAFTSPLAKRLAGLVEQARAKGVKSLPAKDRRLLDYIFSYAGVDAGS